MDLSKRVEVLHPEDIVMYMRGIYRFVHLSAMSKENLFIPNSPQFPMTNIVSLVAVSNYCIELNEQRQSDKCSLDV